ncbi:protein of unknown function (plasmid) [Cupriavidus neocaledonicus]|uniref:Uncharacterized protein n=1 Tax=Cupriavidus neocaledonicus TaxID=1040979 RepID=A0A375HT30_9BURK|nr:hypothetical protein CBM2605_U10022 [Cupriavidus neocaledonicus]SPD59907.1 protein of unknown function [Cupriavidus neocaledonicus]
MSRRSSSTRGILAEVALQLRESVREVDCVGFRGPRADDNSETADAFVQVFPGVCRTGAKGDSVITGLKALCPTFFFEFMLDCVSYIALALSRKAKTDPHHSDRT